MPEPLRTGSRRNGAAFLSAYARLGSSVADAYLALARGGSAFGHLVVAHFRGRQVDPAPGMLVDQGFGVAALARTGAAEHQGDRGQRGDDAGKPERIGS